MADETEKGGRQSLTRLPTDSFTFDELQNVSNGGYKRRLSTTMIVLILVVTVIGGAGYWASTARIGGAVISQGRVIADGSN